MLQSLHFHKGSTSYDTFNSLIKKILYWQVYGRFIGSVGQTDFSMILLTINPTVTVTEHFIPEFSLSSFFADLGGSLGLWLGLGAVQILSNGIGLAMWLKQSFGRPFTNNK